MRQWFDSLLRRSTDGLRTEICLRTVEISKAAILGPCCTVAMGISVSGLSTVQSQVLLQVAAWIFTVPWMYSKPHQQVHGKILTLNVGDRYIIPHFLHFNWAWKSLFHNSFCQWLCEMVFPPFGIWKEISLRSSVGLWLLRQNSDHPSSVTEISSRSLHLPFTTYSMPWNMGCWTPLAGTPI